MILSVPSYVIPGTYAENLRFLADTSGVDGVELLFFMYDDEIRTLMMAEIDEIRQFRSRFSYTVHMPDSIAPEHEDIIEATRGMAGSYVIHPPREDAGLPAFARLMDDWRGRYGKDDFILENTRVARFNAAEAVLKESRHGLPPVCVDIGHLRMEGYDPMAWLEAKAGRVAELHVHGFDGKSDHVPFGADEPWLVDLLPYLHGFAGVVELELFAWDQLQVVIPLLRPEPEKPGTERAGQKPVAQEIHP
ncbi:MAG: cobamide remodeling phosphodiesterase CbiR [Clostridia bacterium]|jgi:sugar phosphate isomerase/epimerase|nr:cobamide remodeling phosphodiesterase CbiR [Spirochaetia bacterium]